jgi:undecaprenyl-diphosphatase
VIPKKRRSASPVHPVLAPAAALVLMAALVFVGWGLGELVAGPLDSSVGVWDEDFVTRVSLWRTAWLTDFMRTATFFGSTAWLVGSLSIVVLVALFRVRSRRWAAFAVACMIGGFISSIVKTLVERPRPSIDPLVHLESYAFPSGHALAAALAFGGIAFFVLHTTRLPRVALWIGAGACVGIVGFTRVYLGVHWPSDVLVGWLLGSCWILGIVWIIRPQGRGGRDHS